MDCRYLEWATLDSKESQIPREKCDGTPDHLHQPVHFATNLVLTDADLAEVVAAWPSLPEAVRADILAMVQASRSGGSATRLEGP